MEKEKGIAMCLKWAGRIMRIGLLIGCLTATACGNVNMDNFNKIQAGMGYDEVAQLLGDADECSSAIGMKNCRWGSETRNIRVQFIADKVVAFSQEGL